MNFWKSDWELVAVVLILASCSVATQAITASGSSACAKTSGKWRSGKGCDPSYCEGASK